MKKLLILMLCALLVLSFAGCNNKKDDTTALPDENGIVDDNELEEEEDPFQSDYQFEDENVMVELNVDEDEFTVADVVGLEVIITNKSDDNLVYIKGSGSNLIPDSLKVELGGLAPMWRPEIMTMDYGLGYLEPGESITYSLPFAAYIPNDENLFAFGTDKDLTFFEEGEFTPAEAGEIEGTLEFRYVMAGAVADRDDDATIADPTDDDADPQVTPQSAEIDGPMDAIVTDLETPDDGEALFQFPNFDDEDLQSVGGSFTVTIAA